MTRPFLVLIGLALLAGCSGGGGGDSSTTSSPPPTTPTAQPDMLTATSQGLLRGKANGQGQRLIFARPNLHESAFSGDIFISNDLVYYPREVQGIPTPDWLNHDIWSVRTDGTGDRAVLNTTDDEFVLDTNGPTVMLMVQDTARTTPLPRIDYLSLRNGALTLLPIPIEDPFTPFMNYHMMAGDRAYFQNGQQIMSINVNGSGLLTHATVSYPTTLTIADVFENTLIFREYHEPTGQATLQAVPIAGGATVDLDDGSAYVSYAGHVGARVISERCAIDRSDPFDLRAGPCDVVSIHRNGSAPVVLTSHSANERVQGVMGNQVIIRRNLLSGIDQLIAVPVTGGAERLLMTMTMNEFVQLVTDDLIILRRPSGIWSLDTNGTLEQLGTVVADSGLIIIGNAVCLNQGAAAWCLPLDGAGPQVKIADTGRVVGAL